MGASSRNGRSRSATALAMTSTMRAAPLTRAGPAGSPPRTRDPARRALGGGGGTARPAGAGAPRAAVPDALAVDAGRLAPLKEEGAARGHPHGGGAGGGVEGARPRDPPVDHQRFLVLAGDRHAPDVI